MKCTMPWFQVFVWGDGNLWAKPADGGGSPHGNDGVTSWDQVWGHWHVNIVNATFTVLRSALRTSLTPEEGIRRIRRSAPNIDRALSEAAKVEKVCSAQFPYCKISRIDILRLHLIKLFWHHMSFHPKDNSAVYYYSICFVQDWSNCLLNAICTKCTIIH